MGERCLFGKKKKGLWAKKSFFIVVPSVSSSRQAVTYLPQLALKKDQSDSVQSSMTEGLVRGALLSPCLATKESSVTTNHETLL